jgi:hypothetical protein
MTMTMIAVTSPFGVFAGYLSDINRANPFILNIVVFSMTIIWILNSKVLKAKDKEIKKVSE